MERTGQKTHNLMMLLLILSAACAVSGLFMPPLLILLPFLLLAGEYLRRLEVKERAKQARELQELKKCAECTAYDVYFSHLLHGTFFKCVGDLIDEGRHNGIRFQNDRFAVIVIKLETWGEIFSKAEPMDKESIRHTYFVLRNVFSDLLGRSNLEFDGEVDGNQICVVNVLQEEADFYGEVRSRCEEAVEFLENQFGITITVTASRVYDGITEIPKAYFEALRILEYNQLIECDLQVTLYDDISRGSLPAPPPSLLRFQSLLLSRVGANDYEGARKVIHLFVNEEFFNARPSVEIVRFRFYGLANTILSVMDEFRAAAGEEISNQLDPSACLMRTHNLSELLSETDDLFDLLISFTDAAPKKAVTAWVAQACAYIDKSFGNPDLTVYSLAERFEISPSHYSRIFKQQTGVGALEYIQRKRLEMAKLLAPTSMTAREIAQKSGFSSPLMLSRAFKRYEGTTPGKFREDASTPPNVG